MHIYTNDQSSSTFAVIYKADTVTSLAFLRSQVLSSATTYLFGEGSFSLRTTTIKENTPTRVVIDIRGVHQTASAQLPNQTECRFTLTFYTNSMVVDIVVEAESTGIVIDDSLGQQQLFLVDGVTGNLTNEGNIHESSGSEADPGTYTASTGEYLGFTSDEVNIIGVRLSGTDTPLQYVRGDGGAPMFQWNNDTLTAGLHLQRIFISIDSAEREYGSQKYTSTERLLLGTQYHDISSNTNLPTITDTKGSLVTDLVIPATLDSSEAMASDGAYHLDADSYGQASATINQAEIGTAVALHDASVLTGDPLDPDEHLIGHWKCDDNAASTVVVDETGNYDGTASGNTSTLTDTDAVKGTSLLLDGSTDSITGHPAVIGTLTDEDKFVLIFKIKPAWAYNIGTSHSIFGIGGSSSNYVDIGWNGSTNIFRVRHKINAGTDQYDDVGSAYTSDAELQQWLVFKLIIDLPSSTITVAINNDEPTPVVSDGATWAEALALFYIGRGVGGSAIGKSFYLDEMLLLDGAVLPYGTMIPQNIIASGDYSKAHGDILFHWDCEASGVNASQIPDDLTLTLNNGATLDVSAAISGTLGLLINDQQENMSVTLSSTTFNGAKGGLEFWFKTSLGVSSRHICRIYADANNYIYIRVGVGDITNFLCQYMAGGTSNQIDTTSGPLVTDVPLRIRLVWKEGELFQLYVNGILEGEDTSVSGTWSGSTPLFTIPGSTTSSFDCQEGSYDDISIFSDPNTTQLPFVLNHGPIYLQEPQGKTLGTDYNVTCLPDMTRLYTFLTALADNDLLQFAHFNPIQGAYVLDMHIPQSLGIGGKASDGVWHLDTGKTRTEVAVKPDYTDGYIVDRSHPLAQGLVGCWLMNEGGGSDVNDLMNNNNGSFGGTPTWSGGYVEFDTAGDEIAISTLTELNYSEGTIIWICNPDQLYNSSTATNRSMWGMLNTGFPEISAQVFSDNNLYVGWYTSGDDDRVTLAASATNFIQNEDNSYAFTWVDSGYSRLYHDGIEIGDNGGGTTVSSIGYELTIGALGNVSNRVFDGGFKLMFIFNRALSAAEIAQLHTNPYKFLYKPETKISPTIDRINPAFALHDRASVRTGDGSVEHCKAWFQLNDDVSGILNEMDNTRYGTVSAGVSFVDFVRSKGVRFDSTTDYISLTATEVTNLGLLGDSGTVEFDVVFDVDETITSAPIIYMSNSGETFIVKRSFGAWYVLIASSWNNSVFQQGGIDYQDAGTIQNIKVSWDVSIDFIGLWINGVAQVDSVGTRNATAMGIINTMYIGNQDGTSANRFEGTIDNLKFYNAPVLSQGTLIPGNTIDAGTYTAGEYNSDITFFWDCETTSTEIGGKTITLNGGALVIGAAMSGVYGYDSQDNDAEIPVVSSDILNPKKGSISFFFNPQEISIWGTFFGFGDADDYIQFSLDGSSQFRFSYTSNSTPETVDSSITATIGQWYHLKATWDDSDYVHFFIDGIEVGTPQVIANIWDGITTGTIYIGGTYAGGGNLDGYFDHIFITNNPNTPDLPFVLGHGPQHINLITES